jgi:ketosteroid isomerase-like protein
MSQESVEIVRRGVAAAIAQPPDLETVRKVAAPDLVLVTDWGADGDVRHGVQGFLDVIAETAVAWDPWHQELEDIIDAERGSVLVLLRLTARGRESGVPVDFPWAMVITVVDGRIAMARAFTDRDAARRTAGLEG